jgi:MoaA/NifB/PqqE/SkfB family radical SAM enzyme
MSNKIAIFSPSHYCNSQCWMCTDLWTSIENYVEPNFEYICNEAKKLKDNGVTSLHISGGEPTVWKRFDDFLTFAYQLNFKSIAVYSNGRTLTKRKIQHCLDNGVTLFLISLHAATAEKGDEIANAPRSFEQTLKGLDSLSQFKKDYSFEISISCVPSMLTEHEVFDMVKLAAKFPIDNFHISYPVNTSFSNPIQKILFPDLKVIKNQLPEIFEYLLKRNIHPVINEIPPCYYKPYLEYYSAAYNHEEERILIGFHSKNGQVTKDEYIPLDSSKMNFYTPECEGCYLKGVCFGIPTVYKNMYVVGELSPFTETEIFQIAKRHVTT